MSFDALCDRLSQEYSPEEIGAQRGHLKEHCDRIQRLAVLRNLLNAKPAA
jgi:hypothetical protein